ncbi:MAG TPA: hypothetical protein VFG47_22230 [Geminicoccaceae bacterium]|nr:hypothetical protein [Geminicoccaceae bacterium]
MSRAGPVPAGRSARQRGLAAVLIAAAVAACSPVRTVEAVRLLSGLAGDPRERAAEAEARRLEIAYAVEDRPRRADVYLPDGTARAALVVVPGAAEEGRRDPRLIAFAGGLTRAGFLVLVPELAGDDQLQISADDAVAIADGVRHLTAAAEVPEVGLAALSYAVGPTVLAALYEDTRPRVRYILAIGGYYDIVAGITYITTGAFRADPAQPWRHAEVDDRAKWIFLRANAGRLDDPADVRLLTDMAERRVRDPGAGVADLAARLGDDGRAVYRLFVNADPDRVPELIAALPAAFREQIEALDLARRDLGRLDADLILIHGRNDPMVPHTESLKLAGAVPPNRADVYLLDDLRHVDLGTPAAGDAWTMVRAAYRLLEARDAAPAPAASPVAAAWREGGRVRIAAGGGRRRRFGAERLPARRVHPSGPAPSPRGAVTARSVWAAGGMHLRRWIG